MPNYDFKILQFNEFECLCRDLLQKKTKNFIESFTEGKDNGIDLRFAYSKSHKTIIQVKRYKNWSDLIKVLKKEVDKVKKLNPQRYILMTSVGLTPNNKNTIYNLFSPYILTESDIYGCDDINNLLGQYPEIEKQYYKLWLSSYNIIENLINKDVVNYTSFEKENIYEDIHRYVHNDSFNKAIEILNKNKIVIISGIPGIGKTTLARMLVYHLLAKGGYEQFVAISGSLDEGVKMFQDGRKQVFYYDDFLGSNTFVPQEKNFDKKLINFINAIKRRQNKVLILTTREYIWADALLQYQSFNTENLELHKCIIDLHNYTKFIRARILYNHLADAQLPNEYIDELIKESNYINIVTHKNFNPRIIEFYIDKNRWKNTKPELFIKQFIDFFNKPESVWETAFNDLSTEGRYMLFILSTTGINISLDDWQTAYNYFVENANIDLSSDPHKWLNNLKILDNSFIKTNKTKNNEIIVGFINPSVLDFISTKLKQQSNTIKLLIQHCYFTEQLYTMFSEQVLNQSNWYIIPIDNHLYPDVVKSFYRLISNFHSCSRESYSLFRKPLNYVEFLNIMYEKYNRLSKKEFLLNTTIKIEWLFNSDFSITSRLTLIRTLIDEKINFNIQEVLEKIAYEDMHTIILAYYISTVKPIHKDIINHPDFIQKINDTVIYDIETLTNSSEAYELNDSLETIFKNIEEPINKKEILDKLEEKTCQLEELEAENSEEYLEDKLFEGEEEKDNDQMLEMFTSLRYE